MIEAYGEVLAVIAGIAVGFAGAWFGNATMRRATWLVLSVVGGAVASWINGEFPLKPEFLLFDAPMVAIVALAVMMGIRLLRRVPKLF